MRGFVHMAWSLRISWQNGQPRASFSHFMWRKPKTRQTNICSFFHNKHLREKTTNLREKTTALSLLRLYQLLFTCLLWKTTRHPLLVQFYTEQTKVQGSWLRSLNPARPLYPRLQNPMVTVLSNELLLPFNFWRWQFDILLPTDASSYPSSLASHWEFGDRGKALFIFKIQLINYSPSFISQFSWPVSLP